MLVSAVALTLPRAAASVRVYDPISSNQKSLKSKIARAELAAFIPRRMKKPPKSGGFFSMEAASRSGPAFPTLLAEAHLLRQVRAGLGVIGRDHRVVGREAPLLAILLGRHVILRAQVALEGLELLSILKTDDVIRRNRLLHRNGGFRSLGRRLDAASRNPHKRRVDIADQRWQVAGRNRGVADVCRDDVRGKLDVIC